MAFDQRSIDAIWAKGRVVEGNDPNVWRKDECGAWMHKPAYGQTTKYGWEIDHISPRSNGGSENLSNLRPLQWQNNRAKCDGRLCCAVRSLGVENAAA